MKKVLFILLLFRCHPGASQSGRHSSARENEYGLYISGGVHLGLWNLVFNWDEQSPVKLNFNQIPFNIQVDKLFKGKYVLGIAFSSDEYHGNPLSFYGSVSSLPAGRQNIRIRYFKYLSDPEKIFASYIGLSAGVSVWKIHAVNYYSPGNVNRLWPTAQFLFGFKIKLTETFFSQTEFGVGPPSFCQTSVGIKF